MTTAIILRPPDSKPVHVLECDWDTVITRSVFCYPPTQYPPP